MHGRIYDEIVELLLLSISKDNSKGLENSFMFGKPDSPSWQHNLGVSIYYETDKLTLAALRTRAHGHNYLKALDLTEIKNALQQFVCRNYWYMGDEVFLNATKAPYSEVVSAESKRELAKALSSSSIFKPDKHITLFPLVALSIETEFYSEAFSLIRPISASISNILPNINTTALCPDAFPPLSDWKGKRELPSAWLAVRSPSIHSSIKMKSAILGALALTPLPNYRHMFSRREVFGGHCTFTDRANMSFGDSHTPPLMHDIIVSEKDHVWLNMLSDKITSDEKPMIRQIRALEYFYRAWALEPSERFPILCMALDAIFVKGQDVTQDNIEGVHETIGSHIDASRIRLLMRLRGSVIHGRAPDVYDSKDYTKYYVNYGVDPIHDLELLVAQCFRLKVFEGHLQEHEDPNAEIIAEVKEKGMLPEKMGRPTILESNHLGK
ncbi:hypothetical protein [Paremcibacter congregatus]|uniref:Apea-like HEPN domain-containing protein n=1 Tax=Paremcibacter congregatus TaxID=2043170 RepID=A0A2G4YUC9_9PROT|nr:hypothetical protein [Paremcibacter congregatus]PHZ85935.1 hypothetical protein CRD36_04470 [Paremcibacter congregatus]QDE26900.1 hypothetical protein FIV45_06240 [Paremcibacter congregatus]